MLWFKMLPAGTIRDRSEHNAVIQVTSGLHPQLCLNMLMRTRNKISKLEVGGGKQCPGPVK